MTQRFDVVVTGLGAMGSAAVYHLARRGVRVLGLDRFTPPHTLGSTHGRTRITRQAYYEHPLYVPLILRAHECWAELEAEAGERLLHRTGGLMVGAPEGVLVTGARRSAETHALPHEVLSAAAIRRRWPALAPDDHMVGVWEPNAGLLLPERCVSAHLELARRHGATLSFGETALRWEPDGGGVRVTTTQGERSAAQLLVAAGAWTQELFPELRLPLEVERQLFHWFEPASMADACRAENCPLGLWEFEPGRILATFPDLGDGVKCGIHHEGEITNPEDVRRTITAAEDEAARALLARVMPPAAGRLREGRVCLYTNTPDRHFLIDRHPAHAQVLLASPCSGHGFKFSSVVGELLADLVTTGASRFDLTPFGLARFD